MNRRELFEIWAPADQGSWTKFAKPSLFVSMREGSVSGKSLQIPNAPDKIAGLDGATTAFIVDLPDASAVENGIGLTKIGFRPVPLYNVVDEDKIGLLRKAVDNKAIVDALKTGAEFLKQADIPDTAAPVFLLDHNRSKNIDSDSGVFDNRWNIAFEDMPDAEYMKQAGIKLVVVWTLGEIQKDLLPIVESYQNNDIEIITFIDGQLTSLLNRYTKEQDYICNFENARVSLMIISGLVLINLFFMFFVGFEPLLWTAPSIMWLTYLWVPEIVGDVLAVILSSAYVALYFLSQKRRGLMMAALASFGIDTAIFYVYVLYYGIDAWFAGILGMFLLIIPSYFIKSLISGVRAQLALRNLSVEEYFLLLDKIDIHYEGVSKHRRHFRGFRGYGGCGHGGYSGYGGGGYSGGFGG